ncbi:MAG: TolC family protein [Candidatus Aminicenantes bacterium]|nr:TolC family protein [Candidatus Aminicenantes bacterium]MDH5705164.1 TolC family protein [Candidatus Aminicenantes bacterium]
MKKGSTVFLVILLTLWTARFSFPQDKITLTLEESIRLALSQNPYHLAAEERVETAKAQVREAAAGFFPALNAQGLHTLDEKLFELEFPDPLTGQTQRISVDFTRDYQFSLSLSLPLFTGGRLTSGFKQAKYNLLSSEEAVRQSEHITVFNAKAAFYGCLLARDFVKVAEEAVGVAEKHFNNVKRLYEVGMASKFDLLRSEVQAANLKPQLIKARNNLKIAELSLKTLLGLDLSQDIEIKGELKFELTEPDLEACISKALVKRPELSQLSYQKKMAGEMLKLARASRLPSLAVSGTYNFWADRLNFEKDTWQNYYSVNLALSVPLFNGFSTSARVAQSKAAIRELNLTTRGYLDMVEFEVSQALLKLNEAKESLLSQGKNVEQAEESLRIAELNFSEGMVTTLDVSSAQAALTQAKTNYSQALFDYVISLAQLDKAMGVGWNN